MNAIDERNAARLARIERIAMILEGQPDGAVQSADVYFSERTERRAESIARRDRDQHDGVR